MQKKKGNALIFFIKTIKARDKYIKPIEDARASFDFEKERKLIYEAVNGWSNEVKEHFDVKYEIENDQYIPSKGPCVFICNHQGYADILPFLTIMPFHVCFVAKKELKRLPLFGPWILRARGLLINRGNLKSSFKTINQGVEYLKDGFSFVIFPEGTRSHGHEMGEFKKGSFKLATKAEVPIIPVTLDGSYHMFEEKNRIVYGTTIKMVFHEPIETKGMSKSEQRELPEKVEKIIRDSL